LKGYEFPTISKQPNVGGNALSKLKKQTLKNMNSNFKLIIVTIFLTFISCNKPTSTLTGNIFWKYNNYVGNKPDAGAKINIYSLDENPKDSVYSTIADINGNFKIENINSGQYFLVVNSKNTKSLPETHLENIKRNSENLSKLFISNFIFI
jgi:hypothetical protein